MAKDPAILNLTEPKIKTMMDCSHHSKEVAGISDMKNLAELIGDLHYESLDALLDHLAVKLHVDGGNDYKAGRVNLGIALQNTALYIQKARQFAKQAWEISKPFMPENWQEPNADNLSPLELFDKLDADAFPPSNGPTVYAVCVRNQMNHAGAVHVLYIGSSMKPQKRRHQTGHPYMVCYNRFPNHLVFFRCCQFSNYLEVERKLINHFKPLFNKQFK